MLVWGLDAAVITFVAPHTLHARPLVVGPDFELEVVEPDARRRRGRARRRPPRRARSAPGAPVTVRFGASRTQLATLPEQTFFGRYGQVFGAG